MTAVGARASAPGVSTWAVQNSVGTVGCSFHPFLLITFGFDPGFFTYGFPAPMPNTCAERNPGLGPDLLDYLQLAQVLVMEYRMSMNVYSKVHGSCRSIFI